MIHVTILQAIATFFIIDYHTNMYICIVILLTQYAIWIAMKKNNVN